MGSHSLVGQRPDTLDGVVEEVRHRFPNTEFVLSEGDALEYEIPEEVDVIYLFNPFDEEATQGLLRKVKPVFKSEKRIDLVYVHPIHCQVLQQELGEPIAVIQNLKGIPEAKVFSNYR